MELQPTIPVIPATDDDAGGLNTPPKFYSDDAIGDDTDLDPAERIPENETDDLHKVHTGKPTSIGTSGIRMLDARVLPR